MHVIDLSYNDFINSCLLVNYFYGYQICTKIIKGTNFCNKFMTPSNTTKFLFKNEDKI
jgi:hypothetical protein